MPFIDDITCTICDMSSSVYDITFTLCVTTHNACFSDITHSMFMTYPLYMASHSVLWQHNICVTSQPLCLTSHPLYLCHLTQFINIIKPSVCMTLHQLYVWHHMHYIWHHNDSLDITSLYICLKSTASDLTSSVYVSSHPIYQWYHRLYI